MSSSPRYQTALKFSGIAWFSVAFVGQTAFIIFILGYYGMRTAAGDFAAWNDKPIIDGYVDGDVVGNAGFISHVLAASVITTAGLMQLLPGIRRRAPTLHRFTGRLFIILAFSMAIGGLALTWGRGTRLNDLGAYATSGNAILIIVTAVAALAFAMKRDIDTHRRWAMHLFLQVNGVWFMRLGYSAWGIVGQGAGIGKNLDGPADITIAFGSYLIPAALLQSYLWAQDAQSRVFKCAATTLVCIATLFTAIGVIGAVAFMWLPYM